MTPCREHTRRGHSGKGYGRRYIKGSGGKYVLMHRWVVAQIHGWDAIEGMDVMHLCDNPRCYRYDHLRIGTHRENMQDAHDKGAIKSAVGEAVGTAKLTEADVPKIIEMHQQGLSMRAIGRHYGVTHRPISDIINGRAWGHVPR